jgi:phosphatidylglycerol:prolipoprotein diacylglycerol transferase
MIEAVLPYPQIDPVLIHLGPLAIRWYALSYVAVILLGWWFVVRMLRQKSLWTGAPFHGKPPATEDDIGDLVVWATLGTILGGRLGWVLIYGVGLCSVSPDAPFCAGLPMGFLTNPIKIVAAWEGGMSFHGGVIGVAIALWLFCRRRKLSLLSIADLVVMAEPIGGFLVRIANFINGELWGRPADVPWAMVFPGGGPLPRHPSQLYEATLEGLVLVAVLFLLMRAGALKRPGLIIGSFAVVYAIARTVSEFFREPDAQLGFLWGGATMGQLLSLPLFLAGVCFIVYALRHPMVRA